MSVDKFRFVSPGVFINEIDQSQVPQQRVFRTGPAIIGRTVKGPAMRPITVSSFSEFVDFLETQAPAARVAMFGETETSPLPRMLPMRPRHISRMMHL